MPPPIDVQDRLEIKNFLPRLVPPFLESEARRQKTLEGWGTAAERVAIFATVARLAPGPYGKIAAIALAGFHKDPVSGKVRPTPGTATNLLPAPLGWTPSEVYGLPKNWWIPRGWGLKIPPFLDVLGFGTKEQRDEDYAALYERRKRDIQRSLELLKNEPSYKLESIKRGYFGGTKAVGMYEFRRILPESIQEASRILLNQRQDFEEKNPTGLRGLVKELVSSIFDPLAAPGVTANPNPPVASVIAVKLFQQLAEKLAPDLLKQLVSEKADP